MFDFNNTPHSEALDKAIADLLEELNTLTGSTDEYSTTAANLAKLMELRNQALKTSNEHLKIQNDHELESEKIQLDGEKFDVEKEQLKSWKPSPDAIVGAAASVLGILCVLHYEKVGVITSKALGFIGKMR